MREIAQVIAVALSDRFESEREALGERTRSLMERYPLYPQLAASTAARSDLLDHAGPEAGVVERRRAAAGVAERSENVYLPGFTGEKTRNPPRAGFATPPPPVSAWPGTVNRICGLGAVELHDRRVVRQHRGLEQVHLRRWRCCRRR